MRSTFELAEQAGDWALMRLLLERPSETWRQRLLDASMDTVDPELTSAVQMAQAEGNNYFHQVLFGADGLLTSRESDYRFERDRGAVLADLEGMKERFGFSWEGSEPADHILALVGLMAHVVSLQADAVRDENIGEALYLEGISEWLRRGHLAWFAEQIAGALNATRVCYLSHVAHALEQRVLPAGEPGKPARRPSESTRDHKLGGRYGPDRNSLERTRLDSAIPRRPVDGGGEDRERATPVRGLL